MNIGFGDLGVCTVGQPCYPPNKKPAPTRPGKPAPVQSILGPIAGLIGSSGRNCFDKKGRAASCRVVKIKGGGYGFAPPKGGTMSGLSGFDPSNPSAFNRNDPNNTPDDMLAYCKYLYGTDCPKDTKFIVLQPQDDNGVMKFLNTVVGTAGNVAAQKLQADIAAQHQTGNAAIVPVPIVAANTNWAWYGGGVVAIAIGGGLLWYFLRKR